MTTLPERSPASVADYVLVIELKATPHEVWSALTADIGRWWPGPAFCSKGPGPHRMSLDARPGGYMYEDAGGGNGMIWGTVVHVEKDRVLQVTGTYGSPLTWVGKYELDAIESGTRLRFSEAMLGRITEAELESKDHGWRYLYDGHLRAYLEGGEGPAWEHEPNARD